MEVCADEASCKCGGLTLLFLLQNEKVKKAVSTICSLVPRPSHWSSF